MGCYNIKKYVGMRELGHVGGLGVDPINRIWCLGVDQGLNFWGLLPLHKHNDPITCGCGIFWEFEMSLAVFGKKSLNKAKI